MSRIRSDIPIYAFTPYKTTSRRVAMYRGVHPVSFEIQETSRSRLYADIFKTLLAHELVEVDDLVIFTKGDLEGVTGSTNAMKILKVVDAG
jgi:pyruvate kinase